MSPVRHFITEEAKVVNLVQQFEPSYFREYLMWTDLWRQDRQNGRGSLPPPIGRSLQRGAGIFWEILDAENGTVQAFLAPVIRLRLEDLLEEQHGQ